VLSRALQGGGGQGILLIFETTETYFIDDAGQVFALSDLELKIPTESAPEHDAKSLPAHARQEDQLRKPRLYSPHYLAYLELGMLEGPRRITLKGNVERIFISAESHIDPPLT
jgi:hypothetical protein